MTDTLKAAHDCCPCIGDAERHQDQEHGTCHGSCRCAFTGIGYDADYISAQPICEWPGHAALDKAVEEAVRTTKDTERAAAERSVMLALAAERERGRREAFDMVYTVAGQTFRGDALATFQNSIADAMNLLQEKPQAAPEPSAAVAETGGERKPSDEEIENSHRIVFTRMNLHNPSDCQKAGAPLDFCCKCGKRLHGMPHHTCHISKKARA